jgi:hypothetical protein
MNHTTTTALVLALLGLAAVAAMPPVPEPPGQARSTTPHHWRPASH